MRHKFWFIGIAAAMLLLPLGATFASKIEPAVKADTQADFAAVTAAVKNEMVPGGRYEFVSPPERKEVASHLDAMQASFAKYGSVEQMDSAARAQLYMDQEAVNAILTQRDDRRVICKSERPVGSLLPKRTCRTYGEIERSRRGTQEFMDNAKLIGRPLGDQ
jgi:hypothetical protein